ncbi:tetratricopeptide repeat protein [Leptospira sp. 201903071]|uniref:tetratricopeptide repeat protein n=1 Tax=Leptospira ainazelensis TaxID=2810034 RepID=UPI0019642A0D|nr:tetratricopeptide repeat protein [Leptospira ainazelensis]MBM9502909.1 tetratricopeptide repeat protein [Leptospira ainazelensis]
MIALNSEIIQKHLNLRNGLFGLVLIFFVVFGLLIRSYFIKKEITEIYNEGTSQYSSNHLDAAKSAFLRVLELDDEHADALFLLGKIEFFSKKFQNAEEYFNRCKTEDSGRLDCFFWKAKSGFLVGKNYESVEEDIIFLKGKGFDHPELFHLQGMLYERAGNLSLALKSYEEALSFTVVALPTLQRMEAIYSKAGFTEKSEKYESLNRSIRDFHARNITR